MTPRKAGEALVRRADDVPARPVTAGTAADMQVLIGADDGAPNFAMRRFRMEAGGGMPLHTNAVEHEQYVLRGRARVTIGRETHECARDRFSSSRPRCRTPTR